MVSEVKEPIFFEIVVTQDEKAVSGIQRATIEIMPDSVSTTMGDATVDSAANSNGTTLKLNTDGTLNPATREATAASSLRSNATGYNDYWDHINIGMDLFVQGTSTGETGNRWVGYQPYIDTSGGRLRIQCNNGWYTYNEAYKYVDLRGIFRVDFEWENKGDKDRSNWGAFQIENNTYKVAQQGLAIDWAGDGSGMGVFPRMNSARIKFFAETNWWKKADLYVYNLKLYKQRFYIEVHNPDNLIYSAYIGSKVSRTVSYNPGGISFSNNNNTPYRDQTVTLIPNYSDEAAKRGTYLAGYRIMTMQPKAIRMSFGAHRLL